MLAHAQELESTKRWVCPHHHCGECGKAASKAGGLLFACQACERAFCEDHLPLDTHYIYDCPRFQHVGHHHPKQVSLSSTLLPPPGAYAGFILLFSYVF